MKLRKYLVRQELEVTGVSPQDAGEQFRAHVIDPSTTQATLEVFEFKYGVPILDRPIRVVAQDPDRSNE